MDVIAWILSSVTGRIGVCALALLFCIAVAVYLHAAIKSKYWSPSDNEWWPNTNRIVLLMCIFLSLLVVITSTLFVAKDLFSRPLTTTTANAIQPPPKCIAIDHVFIINKLEASENDEVWLRYISDVAPKYVKVMGPFDLRDFITQIYGSAMVRPNNSSLSKENDMFSFKLLPIRSIEGRVIPYRLSMNEYHFRLYYDQVPNSIKLGIQSSQLRGELKEPVNFTQQIISSNGVCD